MLNGKGLVCFDKKLLSIVIEIGGKVLHVFGRILPKQEKSVLSDRA
jgi:hypothetical protein